MALSGLDGLQQQLQDFRAHHSLTQRLLLVLLHCTLASAWLHALAKRCAPGWSRLAVAAPVVLMNMVAPLLIDPVSEVCTAAAVAFELIWLSTFKARLWFTQLHRSCLSIYCLPLLGSSWGSGAL